MSAEAPARPKGFSPRMANLLQREPSREELEAARQLVEHSQRIHPEVVAQQESQTSQTRTSPKQQAATPYHSNSHGEAQQSVQYTQASPVPSVATIATSTSRKSPTAPNNTAGGQQCRCALLFKHMLQNCVNTVLVIAVQQRLHYGDGLP